MDSVDDAQIQSDLTLSLAIKNRKRDVELKNTNYCHYCNDPVDSGHFCDSGCRDDYEKMVTL